MSPGLTEHVARGLHGRVVIDDPGGLAVDDHAVDLDGRRRRPPAAGTTSEPFIAGPCWLQKKLSVVLAVTPGPDRRPREDRAPACGAVPQTFSAATGPLASWARSWNGRGLRTGSCAAGLELEDRLGVGPRVGGERVEDLDRPVIEEEIVGKPGVERLGADS